MRKIRFISLFFVAAAITNTDADDAAADAADSDDDDDDADDEAAEADAAEADAAQADASAGDGKDDDDDDHDEDDDDDDDAMCLLLLCYLVTMATNRFLFVPLQCCSGRICCSHDSHASVRVCHLYVLLPSSSIVECDSLVLQPAQQSAKVERESSRSDSHHNTARAKQTGSNLRKGNHSRHLLEERTLPFVLASFGPPRSFDQSPLNKRAHLTLST